MYYSGQNVIDLMFKIDLEIEEYSNESKIIVYISDRYNIQDSYFDII